MPLRLIEMVCPEDRREDAEEAVADFEPEAIWHDHLVDDSILVSILLAAEKAEDVLDTLDDRFSTVEGFRIVMLPVEATLPKPEPDEKEQEGAAEGEEGEETPEEEAEKGRISRQELYEELEFSARLSGSYMTMMLLSGLVAAVGIWHDNVPVIIGAMVITPLLGPNMALALGSALGDWDLLKRAAIANFSGIGAVLLLAVVAGTVLPLGEPGERILWGSKVSLSDIAVALAAGGAGALAVARGARTALVGVMVAVALLPSLVTLGLGVGSGHWATALGAGLLFATNLICINLAGLSTFLAHGIRPHRFYEAAEALKAARRAVLVWVLLLLAIAAAIIFVAGRVEQIRLAVRLGHNFAQEAAWHFAL